MHRYLHKKYKYLVNNAQMGCNTEKDAFSLGVISLKLGKKIISLVKHYKTSKFKNSLY